MHEVITLQIGPQANYVGSHFWNAQESYFTYSEAEESLINHDIHFRAGQGTDGTDTFTPRAVIYDFKTNFGALRRINELYDVFGEQAEETAWTGQAFTHRQPPIAQSPYQLALNSGEEPSVPTVDSVRYWSDYSRVFYHPRSLVQIYDADLPPSDRAFTSWNSGMELYEQLSKDDDLVERNLRPFAEECDQMQGLQVFMESESAWAAFGSRYLEAVRDEFGKVPIWIFGVEGTRSGADEISQRTTRLANTARSLHYTSPNSTLYIPVSTSPTVATLPDYISLRTHHPWHTSALQCTALESLLLPTRLKASSGISTITLDHLALSVTEGEDRHIARLSFEVGGTKRKVELTNGHGHAHGEGDARAPPPSSNDSPLQRTQKQICDLFPDVPGPNAQRANANNRDDHVLTNVRTRRGMEDGDDDEQGYQAENDTPAHHFHSPLRMPLPTSFPRIYSLMNGAHAENCGVGTSLRATSSIGEWVRALERVSTRAVGFDEREELHDGLLSIAEGYAHGYCSDSDEGGEGDGYE